MSIKVLVLVLFPIHWCA